MRQKIIAVHAIIVLILGVLAFVIVRQSLIAAATSAPLLSERAKRDVQGASARLQVDALRMAQWAASRATEPGPRDAVSRATDTARGDAAMAACDAILVSAKKEFPSSPPTLVMIVDKAGKVTGRNGTPLSRGDDYGTPYPGLKEALAKGQSGADVWVSKERSDQLLAVYAPIRDERGHGLVIGMPLNDELAQVAEATTGRGVAVIVAEGDGLRAAAGSSSSEEVKATVERSQGDLKSVFKSGQVFTGPAGEVFVAAAPLDGLGDGHHAVLATISPRTLVPGVETMAFPILGVTALGLILVGFAGWFLGGYILAPITELEEGLLLVLNGQTDKRFELDHAELGGLAYRINQLLNQLMGIEEDTTDEQGRSSMAPTAADFKEAMAVDPGSSPDIPADALSAASISALASEAADAYYARIYGEYIAAKKVLGEGTDHITEAAFVSRIQGMEQDAAQKQGRPVRYQVRSSSEGVTLLAVPIA